MNRVGDYLRAIPTAMQRHAKPLGALAVVYGIAAIGIKAWVASQNRENKARFIEKYRLQVIDQTPALQLLLRPLTVIKALSSLCFPPPSASNPAPAPSSPRPHSQTVSASPPKGSPQEHCDIAKLLDQWKDLYEYVPAPPPSQADIQNSQREVQQLETLARTLSMKKSEKRI